MNTRFFMVLPDTDLQLGGRLSNDVEALVHQQEALMSRFDPASPVSEINRRAGREVVSAHHGLWPPLLDCQPYWQITAGAFDIAQCAPPVC